MFTSNSPSRNPKQPRSSSKRGFNPLASKSKPDLAVDTSFTKHRAQAPKQVFPYESKTQELSFVSFSDLKAARKGIKGSLRQQLENRLPVRPSAQRSLSDSRALEARENARPGFWRTQTSAAIPDALPPSSGPSLQVAPLHKRIKGLRPSPLDLTHEVSPSDRAITIGLSVPSGAVSDHSSSPQSGLQARHQAKEVQTPTIVITPAKEDFGLSYSPEELRQERPASSTYSRYTNCAPRRSEYGRTPPVPPLPLFADRQAARTSARTVFEEDTANQNPTENADSVCTEFEDDESYLQPRSAKRLTSQSHLPTPRRSRGWWNVVTSPFSAGPKSTAPCWRSPALPGEDDDRQRMLDEPSDMGTIDHHAGVIFTNRALEDDELRSALPPDTGSVRPAVPKRSDTAPGALDIGAAPVNIYRVPSQGLAAAYYNADRHFPSLVLEGIGSADTRGVLNGWSTSQSVAHPDADVREIDNTASKGLEFGHLAAEDTAGERELSDADQVASPEHETRGIYGAAKDDEGPFADAHETEPEAFDNHGPRNVFTTPSEEELQGHSSGRPTAVRNDTNATLLSTFSPLTPTPIVEDAHMATYMGPKSSNGELREVQLTPARTRSPPDAAPANASARHSLVEAPPHDRGMESMSEKAPYRPSLHTRTNSSGSRGLGITDGEKELYPPPKAFVTQPRLGTDRFGQLTIRGVEEEERPYVPWYRRMLFPLLFASGLLLLALVVFLVMLIPQAQNDMAVEAEWLNLTGFPPLPTGVATVIQPKAVKEVSGCVQPDILWSCAMLSDQSKDVSAGGGPDFRFEIRFINGTLPKNETQLARRSAAVTAQASKLVRRNGWADSLFAADPPVPSKNDQQFLGQYTDNITLPYDGEQTPFYISILDPSALTGQGSNMMKRQTNPYPYPQLMNTTTNATTTASKTIPRPALHADGKPADPVLYPYAESQPLRLFKRGGNDEHYGFYIYFDRSLFVSNLAFNASASNGLSSTVIRDTPLNNASAVCTFSQTRLHIQIWTRQATVSTLGDPIPLNGLRAINATANDMAAPGSFPYPVTVTLDRHGGQAKQKGVYCYGLSEDQIVLESVKMWVDEERGVGGDLVNAAAVPGSNGTALLGQRDGENHGYGGVDGGDGGCACQWRN